MDKEKPYIYIIFAMKQIINFHYDEQVRLYYSKLSPCQFLRPIDDYDYFLKILENKGLFDIKINTKYNIAQLNLKKGPYKEQEYYDFNEKLRLYCIKNLIYMWK